jgi:hypothetical protein
MASKATEATKSSEIETAVGTLDEWKSISSDDAVLLSMGKKPELKRVYNFWTCEWTARPKYVKADW